MKKILFIINPNAGVDRVKALTRQIETHLDLTSFFYEIAYTAYPRHGTELARQAVSRGVSVIVAVGGDGSVNDVINGIAGSNALLGIIPKGSGNGLARSLGIPLGVKNALETINSGHCISIDLGRANGHLFSSTAGAGFDALIAREFEGNPSRGFMAYSRLIWKHLWHYPFPTLRLSVDGVRREEQIFMLTVANAIQLGYGFKVAPVADLQDGLFDIVVLRKFPRILAFVIALRAFRGTILKSKYALWLRGKKVEISGAGLTSFQFDGEAQTCRQTLTIEMIPGALKVLVKGDRPKK